MPSRSELLDTCNGLRGEKLLVVNETEALQSLNGALSAELESFQRDVWIGSEQQRLVDRFINSHLDATPENSWRQIRNIENVKLVEAFQAYTGCSGDITRVLTVLLKYPNLVGHLLMETERKNPGALEDMSHGVFVGLYGAAAFPHDEDLVLQVLNFLLKAQLCKEGNPRRKIRRGKCAFSRLYKLLSECVFSAKLFLTATLHEPIMNLLCQDEMFLDIDPSKATDRFPPEERIKKFGQEGTPQHKRNVENYRKFVVGKLVALTRKFIEGIRDGMAHFPASLSWLIRKIHSNLLESGQVSKDEINLLCTDLIFTCFICPAITNPEPLGIISDTPVSYIARFNLMQVGQILQTLVLMNYERVDEKLMDLYGELNKTSDWKVWHVLEGLLKSSTPHPTSNNNPNRTSTIQRNMILLTNAQLDSIISTARGIKWSGLKEAGGKEMESCLNVRSIPSSLCNNNNNNSATSAALSAGNSHNRLSPAPSSPHRRRKSPKSIGSMFHHNNSNEGGSAGNDCGGGVIGGGGGGPNGDVNGGVGGVKEKQPDVVVFRVDAAQPKVIGLIPEDSYLEQNAPTKSVVREKDSSGNEKRARFVDSASMGTSDADGASDHDGGGSICSSVEGALLNQNPIPDNLSDMVPISANVSGRGSPNISGRDTPLSHNTEQQVEEVEDVPSTSGGISVTQRQLPNIPVTVNKENREDIEEKFGKFGLPPNNPQLRPRGIYGYSGFDDTHSMVSDSWSTDVVASDTETGDGGGGGGGGVAAVPPGGIIPPGSLPDVIPPDMNRLDLIREEVAGAAGGGGAAGAAVGGVVGAVGGVGVVGVGAVGGVNIAARPRNVNDLSAPAQPDDNKSDTWSVDALASDSEADPVAGTNDEDLLELEDSIVSEVALISLNEDMDQVEAERRRQAEAASDRVRFIEPAEVMRAGAGGGGGVGEVVGGGGSKEGLRRQSSGSSFYSQTKSDIDSELAVRDLEDDATTASGGGGGTLQRRPSVPDSSSKSSLSFLVGGDNHPHATSSAAETTGTGTETAAIIKSSTPTTSSSATTTSVTSTHKTPSATPSTNSSEASEPKSPLTTTKLSSETNSNNKDSWKATGAYPKKKAASSVITNNPPPRVNVPSAPHISSISGSSKPVGGGSTNMMLEKKSSGGPSSTAPAVEKWTPMNQQSAGGGGNRSNNKSSTALSDSGKQQHTGGGGGGGGHQRSSKMNIPDKADKAIGRVKGGIANMFKSPNGRSSTVKNSQSYNGLSSIHQQTSTTTTMTSSNPSSALSNKPSIPNAESADDILSKYKQSGSSSTNNNNGGDGALATLITVNNDNNSGNQQQGNSGGQQTTNNNNNTTTNNEPYYDPNNLTSCKAFQDAKRKLRAVLSSVDVLSLPSLVEWAGGGERQQRGSTSGGSQQGKEDDLRIFLNLLLAEAIHNKDKKLSIELREVVRCIAVFDNKGLNKLAKVLKDEYRRRTTYLAYLQHSRLTLLQLQGYLTKMKTRVQREHSLSQECLVDVLIRMFMEKQSRNLLAFCTEFKTLSVQDEKTDCVGRFLTLLNRELDRDVVWKDSTMEQLEYARRSVERALIAQIYRNALYPNGDIDIKRDEVLHMHIAKLARVVTPSHRVINIPPALHGEAPWPSAQAEFSIINAYKSARDKLGCIVRGCETVENLIGLALSRSPSADDITPVLVFVIIQANPPSLMSNMDYISGFYSTSMVGEEGYRWTQFCSAVQFIKTMDSSSTSNNG